MKALVVATAVLTCLSASLVASAQPTVRFVGNGAYAQGRALVGGSEVNFGVFRGGTPQSPETWLEYQVWTCGNIESDTKYACSWLQFTGRIPDADFVLGPGGRSAALNTNGSSLSGWKSGWVCDLPDMVSCTTTNEVVPGSAIAISWTQSSDIAFRQSGSQVVEYFGARMINNGTSAFKSATASVAALGATFAATDAYVGTTHNTSITIEKTR